MKRNLAFIALTLMGLAMFYSCKKSSSGGSPVYPLTATVNGTAFNAQNCIALATDSSLDIYGGNFKGSIPVYPFVLVSILKYKGVGTYDLGTNWIAMGYVDSSNSAQPASLRGTLVITAATPDIIGTFSFACNDSTKVTSGSFKAKAP